MARISDVEPLLCDDPKLGSMKKDYEKAHFFHMCRIHSDQEYAHEERLGRIVEEVKHRIAICKREIFNIGELLVEAKKIVGHGNFKNWIADNFDFSYETANNFMNVYNTCLANPKLVDTIKASVLYQIAAPGFPEDLREHLFEHEDLLEGASNSDIKELLTKFKAGELDLASQGLQNYHRRNMKLIQLAGLHDRITLCIRDVEKHKDAISRLGTTFYMGYEGTQGLGRDREAGEEIHKAINVMNEALQRLRALQGE